MTNVSEVGHLLEQSTKTHNIRPELAVFHGYTFERSSNSVIEVWIPHSCEACGCEIRTSSMFVRTGSASNEEIRRHGLKLFQGTKPVRGLKILPHSPYHCEPCRDDWLKGKALESLGLVQEYTPSWS